MILSSSVSMVKRIVFPPCIKQKCTMLCSLHSFSYTQLYIYIYKLSIFSAKFLESYLILEQLAKKLPDFNRIAQNPFESMRYFTDSSLFCVNVRWNGRFNGNGEFSQHFVAGLSTHNRHQGEKQFVSRNTPRHPLFHWVFIKHPFFDSNKKFLYNIFRKLRKPYFQI